MEITLQTWLQLTGILIFISGIIIIVYSKKYTIKTVFKSEENDINASWMGPVGWIPSYHFDVNLKIKFISNIKKTINYKIIGTALKGALGSVRSADYTIDKTGYNGKYSIFTLNSNYNYTIDIGLSSTPLKGNKAVWDDKEYDLNLNDPVICHLTYEVFKVENPYEWLFSVGLNLLTIGTVIFVAGLK